MVWFSYNFWLRFNSPPPPPHKKDLKKKMKKTTIDNQHSKIQPKKKFKRVESDSFNCVTQDYIIHKGVKFVQEIYDQALQKGNPSTPNLTFEQFEEFVYPRLCFNMTTDITSSSTTIITNTEIKFPSVENIYKQYLELVANKGCIYGINLDNQGYPEYRPKGENMPRGSKIDLSPQVKLHQIPYLLSNTFKEIHIQPLRVVGGIHEIEHSCNSKGCF